MEDDKAARVCGRCQKEVAEANFALHESHCKRFLVLCPDCDENVPRSELQTHQEEQHALVRCPKCRKKMEKRLLAEHEEEQCPARMEPCVYCDLEMPWSELQEHTVACGSRTELCVDCRRYVKLSDREEHDITCSAQDLQPEEPPGAYGTEKATTRQVKSLCNVCRMMFPADEINQHEARCTALPKWNNLESDSDDDEEAQISINNLLRSRFGNLFQDQPEDLAWTNNEHRGATRLKDDTENPNNSENPNELDTCPYCQLVLPLTTLRWHQVRSRKQQSEQRYLDFPVPTDSSGGDPKAFPGHTKTYSEVNKYLITSP